MTDVQVREPGATPTKRAITLVDGDVHSTMMPGSRPAARAASGMRTSSSAWRTSSSVSPRATDTS